MGAGGLVRGDITVDGHPKVHETFRRIASYVEQVPPTTPPLSYQQLSVMYLAI